MPTGPPTAKPGETILSGWGPQSVTKTCLATQFVGPEEHLAAMKLTGSPETKENVKLNTKGQYAELQCRKPQPHILSCGHLCKLSSNPAI